MDSEIFKSSWYANANARLLFQHILTHVVYSEKGIYETNYSVICKETGLTMMALRIALKKLEGIVTIKQNNTKRNTKMLFTISDLGIINNTKNNTKGGISPPTTQRATQRTTQKDAEKSGSYGTSTTQRATQRTTSRREEIECLPPAPPTKDKEEKNYNNIIVDDDNVCVCTRLSITREAVPDNGSQDRRLFEDFVRDHPNIVETYMLKFRMKDKQEFWQWVEQFLSVQAMSAKGCHRDERDLMSHFFNWCAMNYNNIKKTEKNDTNQRINRQKQFLNAFEQQQFSSYAAKARLMLDLRKGLTQDIIDGLYRFSYAGNESVVSELLERDRRLHMELQG